MKRRIISGDVVLTDQFLSMSRGAQLLYFALNLYADDCGFVQTVRVAMSMIGAGEAELAELDGRYIIYFGEEHTALIVHWLKHNTLRKLLTAKSEHPDLEERVYVDETGLLTLDPGEGRETLAEYKAIATYAKIGEEPYNNKKQNKTQQKKTKAKSTEVNSTESRITPLSRDQTGGAGAGARETDKNKKDKKVYANEADRLFDEYLEAEPKELMPEGLGKMLKRKLHQANKGIFAAVFLSEKQYEALCRLAPPEAVDRYVERLANLIENEGADPRSHYQTIRKWIAEDIKP